MDANWVVLTLLGSLISAIASSSEPLACSSGLQGDTNRVGCASFCSRTSHCGRCQCRSCGLCNMRPPSMESLPLLRSPPFPSALPPPPPRVCESGLPGDSSIEKCSSWCKVSEANSHAGHCSRCQCKACIQCRKTSGTRLPSEGAKPSSRDRAHATVQSSGAEVSVRGVAPSIAAGSRTGQPSSGKSSPDSGKHDALSADKPACTPMHTGDSTTIGCASWCRAADCRRWCKCSGCASCWTAAGANRTSSSVSKAHESPARSGSSSAGAGAGEHELASHAANLPAKSAGSSITNSQGDVGRSGGARVDVGGAHPARSRRSPPVNTVSQPANSTRTSDTSTGLGKEPRKARHMHMVGLFRILSPGKFACVLGLAIAIGRRYAPVTLARIADHCNAYLPKRCADAVSSVLLVTENGATADAEGSTPGSATPASAPPRVKWYTQQRAKTESAAVDTQPISAWFTFSGPKTAIHHRLEKESDSPPADG